MEQMESKMREAFEEWFEADLMPLEHSNWFKRDPDGDYTLTVVSREWSVWQAAWNRRAPLSPAAAGEVERLKAFVSLLPEQVRKLEITETGTAVGADKQATPYAEGYANGWRDCIRWVRPIREMAEAALAPVDR